MNQRHPSQPIAAASALVILSVTGVAAYAQFSLAQTLAGTGVEDALYRITSDGGGIYLDDPRTSGKDNDYLDSYAERTYGNDVLDLTHSQTRTLCLSFGQQGDQLETNLLEVLDSTRPLPASGCFPATLSTKSGGPGNTGVGETTYDGFGISWVYEGRSYTLTMGSSAPGTDRVRVSCTDAAGSICNNWQIEPSGCAPGHVNDPDGICQPGRGRVFVYSGKARNAQWYPVADYAMPFLITAGRY